MKYIRKLVSLTVVLMVLFCPMGRDLLAQDGSTASIRQIEARLFNQELPETLPESQREFIRQNSFDNADFRNKQLQIQGALSAPNAQGSNQRPEVRMIYIVPSDKTVRREYIIAIQNAILHLQAFYREQMLNGHAFSVHSPVVEVYQSSHPSNFYTTGQNSGTYGFFNSVVGDGFTFTGGGFNDPNNRWIFYVDASPACGQVGGAGTAGVAVLPSNDLRGLTGQSNIPPCSNEQPDRGGVCRWVGGLGHEVGHSFNLPHPPGCDQNDASVCGNFPYNSLMYIGYATFPITYLLDQDRASLMSTGFFAPFNLETPGASYCSTMTQQSPNPIDIPGYFVRWNFKDFLTREPDDEGASFWTNQIAQCGSDAACIDAKRVDVSAAFFISIEFQETGYLVYRMHQAAFNTGERLRLQSFLPDTQRIAAGVVVNQQGWEQQLEQNKQAYAAQFVARQAFRDMYPQTMNNAAFVDALNAHTGNSLSQAERDDLVGKLNAGTLTRAQVLRAVAEDADFQQREFNRAFVLMQYFGYLRRNPDDAPDNNFNGFNFWLNKLDEFGGDFRRAEMVRSFIISGEYRSRFGR